MEAAFRLRLATEEDIPALHALIEASVRGLCTGSPTTGLCRWGGEAVDYTPAQIEGALGTVLGLDTQLIQDRTYFIAEQPVEKSETRRLAGCGGWSKRKTLFGADSGPGREPELLDPCHRCGEGAGDFCSSGLCAARAGVADSGDGGRCGAGCMDSNGLRWVRH